MRNLRSIIALGIIGIFIASCSNTNNVVSNKLISKRKYTKGFHFNKKSHYGTQGDNVAEEDFNKENKRNSEGHIHSSNTRIEETYVPDNTTVAEENIETAEQTNVESPNKQYTTDGVEESGKQLENDIRETYKGELSAEAEDDIEVNQNQQSNRPDTSDPVMLILLVILAIILPPLAILIYEGATGIFWIDLILFLLAWGGFWFFRLSGLLGLAAVIIALLVIFEVL